MQKEEFIKKALDFVHNKKYSVIPVGMDKRPLIDWKEYQMRFPTDEEIMRWAEFPSAQLGIVTGELSGITVVDVEKGGDASFLPQNTTIVETGGCGAHLYYSYYPGLKNKARIRELCDIRSEGGYVVAPGSESIKGKYTLVQDLPLLPFPEEFAKEITAPEVDIFALADFAPDDMANYQPKQIEEYAGASKGLRNESMTKYIGHVLSLTPQFKWETEAWQIVRLANQRNSPPLPDTELRRSFDSIKGKEALKPPRPWFRSGGRSYTPAPPKKDWEEPEAKEDGRIMLMSEAAKLQHVDISTVYPLGYEIFDTEIMGGAIPGDVIVIAGQTGHGKTTFAMNLSKNLMDKGGRVLFFSYEMLVQFVWDKFKSMGLKDEDCIYCPFKNVTGNVEWIEGKIKEAKEIYDVKFIVIDHLGFLAPKFKGFSGKMSENYSVYLTSIMRDLKNVAKLHEVIIILPVHMRKQQAFFTSKKNKESDIDDIANSAGIGQESDLVFLIQRERDTRENTDDVFTGYSKVSLAKNRRGSKNPKSYFTLLNEVFVRDENYKGIDSMFKKDSASLTMKQNMVSEIYNKLQEGLVPDKHDEEIKADELFK